MTHKTTIALSADGVLTDEPGHTRVHLTAKEAGIMMAIAGRKGSILSKEAILTELYQGRDEPAIKIVDVYVCKVRKKLGEVGCEEAVETVWGRGYKWHPDVRLVLPDSNHVSAEVTPELGRRLEDLAIATEQTVGEVVLSMIISKIDEEEREAWKL